jgi:hypothetical protein
VTNPPQQPPYPPTQPGPAGPPTQPAVPQPPAKKRQTGLIIALAVVGLLLLISVVSCVAITADRAVDRASRVTAATPAEPSTFEDEGETEPTDEPTDTGDFQTTEKDWKATLKVTDKQCFGSAGCNVDVRVKIAYYGDASDIPEDATIEITYKIKGASDGSVIGSTTVTNQTEYDVNTESVETRSSGTKLSVVITDVEAY